LKSQLSGAWIVKKSKSELNPSQYKYLKSMSLAHKEVSKPANINRQIPIDEKKNKWFLKVKISIRLLFKNLEKAYPSNSIKRKSNEEHPYWLWFYLDKDKIVINFSQQSLRLFYDHSVHIFELLFWHLYWKIYLLFFIFFQLTLSILMGHFNVKRQHIYNIFNLKLQSKLLKCVS
jgi:hypothetical protein